MIIRQETESDHDQVYELVKQSFATTTYSDGTEQDYLNEIRKKNSFIPELSLVAVESDMIVGQVVLYEMQINGSDTVLTQLVLSPLSVRPAYFGQGIGSKLISEGCIKAKELGYQAVFLCGDFPYYSKFGFVPTCEYGIYHINDNDKNAPWCMGKELKQSFFKDVAGIIDIE